MKLTNLPRQTPRCGRTLALALATVGLWAWPSPAVTLFNANFDNSPFATASSQNAVTALSDLGVPSVGNWSFSASPVGRIAVGATGTDKALCIGHAGTAVNMTLMQNVGVTFSGTYPETQVADSGVGDVLKAVFAEPGKFSQPNEKTVITFDWGIFGTSNPGAFKYAFVAGYDSLGNQVFELLLQGGSVDGTRNLFARGAADATTTLNSASTGTPQGTAVITSLDIGINSTRLNSSH